ncbi:phosphate ABC transporter substrate-binding protein PstS family protein [Lentibacillus cibarius]|uniref:Phosphate-binding protein n=1 Tax=Lentibacillus cibarius TaxID=2583219 RepID=A0A5S3R7V1_9BACI|nr:phosphate ABC transporter substrate-binding protein PstS family protein [Lentibacillus cibarius]TMN22713.1 phosphate ABC transporter substrate-binding protein PstS family protein [Lentibacillus cibarius]
MKKIKLLGIFVLFVLIFGVLAACGAEKEEQENSTSSGGNSGSIVVSGSSAMQPLVAAAAEKFTAQNPETDITVNAGGSGTGLSEVSEGTVEIGNSDVFAEKKDGIPADELVDHKVAVVGITAAVNPKAGIDNLSKENLSKVFTKEVTNWSEVGGNDQAITLVNRPDSSGTRATFVNFALNGATPAEGVTENSSNTVRKIVEETPGAIGYLAFSYFTDKDSVVPLSIDGVEATDENVQSGEFPVWAYQHAYTKGEPDGLTKAFLQYLLSDDIQGGLVPEQGYIAASKMQVERDAKGNLTNK